ncbi:hypothetical protein D3C86_768230 [compost metagenome]
MATLSEILNGRKIGIFPVGKVKPAAERLASILPRLGLTAEQTAQAIADFQADDEAVDFHIHFRRITSTENERLRAIAKKKPSTVDPKSGKWSPEEVDVEDLARLRLGYGLTEPAFPEGMELPSDLHSEEFVVAVRKRADYIRANFSDTEIRQLAMALAEHCSFDLQAAKDRVKN